MNRPQLADAGAARNSNRQAAISAPLYERLALSRNKAALLSKAADAQPGDFLTPEEAFRDPFVLEFLDIDMLRGIGARNIVLLDGLGYAQWTNDLFPFVHDSIPNRLALAVHPYFDGLKQEPTTTPEAYFLTHFGRDAANYPMIATEWNAVETNGCIDDRTPEIALSLVRYLQHLQIGLIGWAIDSEHGKLVKDHVHFEPTDYDNFQGCAEKKGRAGLAVVGCLSISPIIDAETNKPWCWARVH